MESHGHAPRLKLILFDAVGTLFHLPRGVGYHYALVGRGIGLDLEAAAFDHAFKAAWQAMPPRLTTGAPREDDDKGWWRKLVEQVLDHVTPQTQEMDRDAFFETAYSHFAEAGVWEPYPEVLEVLEQLHPRFALGVISNFDGRLRMVLEQMGIAHLFRALAISSEIGADKPAPLIFERALELCDASADETLHVGDDPVRDWEGAATAGLQVFKLDRPRNSLRDLLAACAHS